MSLPKHLQETFSPDELQFIVENEPIRIFPRITTLQKSRKGVGAPYSGLNSWKLITVPNDPLNSMVAMKSTSVALWLALVLKQQSKCNIIIPDWLTVDALDSKIQYEKKHTDRFSSLPWDWLVLSEILFKRAPDDFADPIHSLRSRIQDLKEIRQAKVWRGLRYLNESHLQLDNLSLMEINELRPFVVGIMDKLREIHTAAHGSADNDKEGDAEADNDDDNFVEYGTLRSDRS